ncbi:MAG: MerR family transcriptional regulator [Acidobacteria bacterium]|nr:MerR family transcriptional regulator [Acidobacteriota bacterium]
MNLTLSIDDRLLKEAREVGRAMGKSVNQLVREYLEQLTSRDDAARDIEELRQLSLDGGGRSGGRRVDRESLHERA